MPTLFVFCLFLTLTILLWLKYFRCLTYSTEGINYELLLESKTYPNDYLNFGVLLKSILLVNEHSQYSIIPQGTIMHYRKLGSILQNLIC